MMIWQYEELVLWYCTGNIYVHMNHTKNVTADMPDQQATVKHEQSKPSV